jgi:hypothetical protein
MLLQEILKQTTNILVVAFRHSDNCHKKRLFIQGKQILHSLQKTKP